MKELRDQSAHFAVAFAILVLPIWLGWFGAALAGFLIGLVREATEEAGTVTPLALWRALHSLIDLTFWTLGGLAVGVMFHT